MSNALTAFRDDANACIQIQIGSQTYKSWRLVVCPCSSCKSAPTHPGSNFAKSHALAADLEPLAHLRDCSQPNRTKESPEDRHGAQLHQNAYKAHSSRHSSNGIESQKSGGLALCAKSPLVMKQRPLRQESDPYQTLAARRMQMRFRSTAASNFRWNPESTSAVAAQIKPLCTLFDHSQHNPLASPPADASGAESHQKAFQHLEPAPSPTDSSLVTPGHLRSVRSSQLRDGISPCTTFRSVSDLSA